MAASVRVVGYDSPFAAPAQAAWNPEGWYTAQSAAQGGSSAVRPSLGGHTVIIVVLALVLLIAIAAHHGRLPFAGAAVRAGL